MTGHNPPKLSVQFPGTGAADHDWKNIGSPGVRGSTSTLLDGKLLIDAGVTAFENLERAGIAPSQISALLITHTHIDHFDPAAIGKIIAARNNTCAPLDIYVSPQGAERLREKLPELKFNTYPLRSTVKVRIGNFTVTALPSNHLLENWDEETFWFLIETPAGNMLYALDGAWMTPVAAAMTKPFFLDWIVWDGTMEKAGNWRSFEHSDLDMISMQINALISRGNVSEKTLHIITHMAATLWPSQEESRKIIAAKGYFMAHDGLKLELVKAV